MEKYHALCTERDCFVEVHEDDIERNAIGYIYERSKKCWECRTKADRVAIKKWRKEQRKKVATLLALEPTQPLTDGTL